MKLYRLVAAALVLSVSETTIADGHKPSMADSPLSVTAKEQGNPLDYLPYKVGARWRYHKIERESCEVDGIGTVTSEWWEQISSICKIAEGKLISFDIIDRSTSAEATGKPCKEWLDWVTTQQRPEKRYVLIVGPRVFELPQSAIDTTQNKPKLQNTFNLDEVDPDYFFPMTEPIWWASKSMELCAKEAFESWVRNPAKAGESLESKTSDCQRLIGPPDSSYFWIVEGFETVTTSMGTIDHTAHLRYQTRGGALQRWFKPGLGLVKETFVHGGSFLETETTLMEFQPGGSGR